MAIRIVPQRNRPESYITDKAEIFFNNVKLVLQQDQEGRLVITKYDQIPEGVTYDTITILPVATNQIKLF